MAEDLEKLRNERDLYLSLLRLGKQSDVEPFLEQALVLIVELTKARRGYIELSAEDASGVPRTWTLAHGCGTETVEEIRSQISRGIIAEAVATGKTILTPSALLDERFASRASVRLGRIEAALCVPVGSDPPLGVIYLDTREGGSAFDEADRLRAELFGQHLTPFAERLVRLRLDAPEVEDAAVLQRALGCEGFVGRSRAFADVLRQTALVAPLDVHVLLTGDSGTGKTQLARILHANSRRASEPFVEVNCAALPEALIENELFGSVAGGHSTAQTAVEGKIAAAGRGTLFLDEIGELHLAAQAKLLQFLQSKQYYRLGAARPTHADLRIVAAANNDLRAAVAERRFREDLLYRLEVVPIRLPALVERRGDVPHLVDHFCAAAIRRHALPGLSVSPGARRAIEAAEWPGNLRQLEHAIEAAAIRAAGSGTYTIEAHHVFPTSAARVAEAPVEETFQQATRRFHEQLLRSTLERCDWNVTEAARRLDIARSHVYNLIRAYGLKRE